MRVYARIAGEQILSRAWRAARLKEERFCIRDLRWLWKGTKCANLRIAKKINMIHIIVGTKAQLIKVAPIILELQKRRFAFNFIFTGQHQETISELQEIFRLRSPNIILYEGKDITGVAQMLRWLTRLLFYTIFNKHKIFNDHNENDVVLVHGDTASTLLGALMGRLAGKRVAHIESGLRSFNLFHPFPEEITRRLTSHLSHIYYCPDQWALNNLARHEGEKINTQGNTLYDSLQIAKAATAEVIVDIPTGPFGLVSLHRFENIFSKRRLRSLLEAITKISSRIRLLFILHKPTEERLREFKLADYLAESVNIELRPRYDYFRFIKLVHRAEFIVTDGGSNQEETSYLGKPTLLFRKATERLDGLNGNVVVSEFDMAVMEEFVANYRSYNKEPLELPTSPSEIIVNHLQQLQGVNENK